jgi:hypothetical protein
MPTIVDHLIASPAAWRGEKIASSDEWVVHLDLGQLNEIEAALNATK